MSWNKMLEMRREKKEKQTPPRSASRELKHNLAKHRAI